MNINSYQPNFDFMEWLIELIKANGLNVLPFIALYLLYTIDVKKWEKREERAHEIYNILIESSKEEREKDFRFLQDTLDESRANVRLLNEAVMILKEVRRMTDRSFSDTIGKLERFGPAIETVLSKIEQMSTVRCRNFKQ